MHSSQDPRRAADDFLLRSISMTTRHWQSSRASTTHQANLPGVPLDRLNAEYADEFASYVADPSLIRTADRILHRPVEDLRDNGVDSARAIPSSRLHTTRARSATTPRPAATSSTS